MTSPESESGTAARRGREAARAALEAEELFPPGLVAALRPTTVLIDRVFRALADEVRRNGDAPAAARIAASRDLALHLAELAGMAAALDRVDEGPTGEADGDDGDGGTDDADGNAILAWSTRLLGAGLDLIDAQAGKDSRIEPPAVASGRSVFAPDASDRDATDRARLAAVAVLVAERLEPGGFPTCAALIHRVDPRIAPDGDTGNDPRARLAARLAARSAPGHPADDEATARLLEAAGALRRAVLPREPGDEEPDPEHEPEHDGEHDAEHHGEKRRVRGTRAGLALAHRAVEWVRWLRRRARERGPDPADDRGPGDPAPGTPDGATGDATTTTDAGSAPVASPTPRRIEDLDEPAGAREEALRVATARVVFADHRLLLRDFPALARRVEAAARELEPEQREDAARRQVEAWLLDRAALVSTTQAAQTRANTPIETRGDPVEVFRPPQYGRALVVPVGEATGPFTTPETSATPDPSETRETSATTTGLLDVKGTGVARGRTPRPDRHHRNGLLPLGDALYEILLQSLIGRALEHAGSAHRPLPIYALLDLGFDGRGPVSPEPFPAGQLVRRAHRRRAGGHELTRRGSRAQAVHLEVELILRQYGITSCRGGFHLAPGDSRSFAGDRYSPWAQEVYTRLAGLDWGLGEEAPDPVSVRLINIQTTRSIHTRPDAVELLDFASYEVMERFDDPILTLVEDRPLRWGGALRPADPSFLQPRPELAAPVATWGGDALYARAGELARRFRAGELDGEGVRAAVDDLLEGATGRWPR